MSKKFDISIKLILQLSVSNIFDTESSCRVADLIYVTRQNHHGHNSNRYGAMARIRLLLREPVLEVPNSA
jgi:hypothetical protein